jgi:hypothetical protein
MDIQALLSTPKTPRITDCLDNWDVSAADSQASTQSWDSQIGLRPSSPIPSSQASTQSWDSRMGPRPSESPSPSPDFDLDATQTTRQPNNLPLTRSDRIRVKTALDFNIPFYRIRAKYGFTYRQI